MHKLLLHQYRRKYALTTSTFQIAFPCFLCICRLLVVLQIWLEVWSKFSLRNNEPFK